MVSGQPTAPPKNYKISDCSQLSVGWYGSQYPEDMIAFSDGSGSSGTGIKRLVQNMKDGSGFLVCSGGTVSETVDQVIARTVVEHAWFYDYPNGRIYIGFDPILYTRIALTTWPGFMGAAFATDSNHKWDNGVRKIKIKIKKSDSLFSFSYSL